MIKNWNKKVVLGIFTLLLIVAIICVSSFIPFIIDPTRFMNNTFLTNELIIIAITLSSTITVMFIAQASNMDNPKSDICKARVEFAKSVDTIDDLTKFYQWIKKVLRVRDKEEIIEREMNKLGVEPKVYFLDNNQIKELAVNPQKFDDVFYKRLDETIVKEVLKLKKKINKLSFVEPNYYTTVKSIAPNKTNSEKASSEGKKKVLYIAVNLTTKVILTLVFAMIITSLVVDTQTAPSQAQAWLDFLSRMFAFVSSAFLGWLVGSKLNDIDAFYILNRVEAHRLYKEDKDFKKVDEAKEEYIERVKKESLLITMSENIDISQDNNDLSNETDNNE